MLNHIFGRRKLRIWLVYVPTILLAVGFITALPMLLTSSSPQKVIPSRGGPPDIILKLTISLTPLTHGVNPESFEAKWNIGYHIMANSTREPGEVCMATIPPSGTGFGIPFEAPGKPNTFYFWIDDKLIGVDYNSWSFVRNSTLQLNPHSEMFPIDTYISPKILIWTSDGAYPKIELRSGSFPGFVLYLKEIGIIDRNQVYKEFNLVQRLAFGFPANDPLAFQIIAQRNTSSLGVYLAYLFFIFFAIYYVAALSRLARFPLNQKIQIFVGLSIAGVAFLWMIRQAAGALSYAEIVIMAEILTWILLEAKETLKPLEF